MAPSPLSYRSSMSANQFIEVNARRLAYRSLGDGVPLILCTRFRGNMDLWDPAFLDALADKGFRVITFDYSGLGLSSGEATYDPGEMVRDVKDLMHSLELGRAVVGGWSLGGMVAQLALAMMADRISHVVLLATSPPGPIVKAAEQLFYETAAHPVNTSEDEVILFFEPRDEASRIAARASAQRIASRQAGHSVAVPWEWALKNLGSSPKNPAFPAAAVLDALRLTSIPVLHIAGDHDIVFPVENWYALNQRLPTLQLHTFPRAGHAPHHQHPQAAAECIATFVQTTS